jgi:hypothetical protein
MVGYTGSRIDVPRSHYSKVPFSLKKMAPFTYIKEHVNSGTGLEYRGLSSLFRRGPL